VRASIHVPIKTKRIHEPAEPGDGYRLLVMRYWPRGVAKSRVDGWDRRLTPTRGLLAELNDGAIDWPEYACRFRHEMATRPESVAALGELRERAARETVTLLCWCPDEARCHRAVLKELAEAGPACGAPS